MDYLDAEALLIEHFLTDAPAELRGVHFSTDVPSRRPAQFVTVERVGGDASQFQDHPQVAVQAWAQSRADAERLCGLVKTDLNSRFRYNPAVSLLELGAQINFPDPDSRQSRFQLLVSFRTSAF